MGLDLNWLPSATDLDARLTAAADVASEDSSWDPLIKLAGYRMSFLQVARLDRFLQKQAVRTSSKPAGLRSVKLALLGSSTLKHLIPGIRVAGLRKGLWFEIFEGDYGQYLQELMDKGSSLYTFKPDFICFCFDARHIFDISRGDVSTAMQTMRLCWKLALDNFSCGVIQQSLLPVFPETFGNNEHRLATSPQRFLELLNRQLETEADLAGVNLLTVQRAAAEDGIASWHDPALWLRTRQEVHPRASVYFGDLLARLLAAQLGRSSKCLVLDLDNTLWGGVIGDDGMDGIVLAEGNPEGEAFRNLQRYALALKDRGVILAVCSKNDEANARAPFREHPDMLLKESDIACFVANWSDKAGNLRQIAATLNIGIDSLVFVDDNPFERNLVRQELPEVAVPEMPEDPALYVRCLSEAGYFEALHLTEEDRARAEQYRANAIREQAKGEATDLDGYLKGLEMKLVWEPFSEAGLQRTVQLINKTNQFNLTTRRYTESDVRSMLRDPDVLTWQMRLADKFGDNGVIALVIGRVTADQDLLLDTWLMSCRVLGRQVEFETLNLIAAGAKARGLGRVIGEYYPTAKNAMVKDLFQRLGFTAVVTDAANVTVWSLDVNTFEPRDTHIEVLEVTYAGI